MLIYCTFFFGFEWSIKLVSKTKKPVSQHPKKTIKILLQTKNYYEKTITHEKTIT